MRFFLFNLLSVFFFIAFSNASNDSNMPVSYSRPPAKVARPSQHTDEDKITNLRRPGVTTEANTTTGGVSTTTTTSQMPTHSSASLCTSTTTNTAQTQIADDTVFAEFLQNVEDSENNQTLIENTMTTTTTTRSATEHLSSSSSDNRKSSSKSAYSSRKRALEPSNNGSSSEDEEAREYKKARKKKYKADVLYDSESYQGTVSTQFVCDKECQESLRKCLSLIERKQPEPQLHPVVQIGKIGDGNFKPCAGGYGGHPVNLLTVKVDGKEKTYAIKAFNREKDAFAEVYKCRDALEKLPVSTLKMAKFKQMLRPQMPAQPCLLIFDGAEGKSIYDILTEAADGDFKIEAKNKAARLALKAATEWLAKFHYETFKFEKTKDCVAYEGERPPLYSKNHQKSEISIFHDKPDETKVGITPTVWCERKMEKLIQPLQKGKLFPEWKDTDGEYVMMNEELNEICEKFKDNHNKLNLTCIHGDAHLRNVFYGGEFTELSQGITMIDYSTMAAPGDPAEDIGRLIGSIWNWGAEYPKHKLKENLNSPKLNKQLREWQRCVVDYYIEQLKQRLDNLDEELLISNIKFYKIGYFRAVLTNTTDAVIKNFTHVWGEEINRLYRYRHKKGDPLTRAPYPNALHPLFKLDPFVELEEEKKTDSNTSEAPHAVDQQPPSSAFSGLSSLLGSINPFKHS